MNIDRCKSAGIKNNTAEYRVLSGSTLKLIALITMIIDHIGAYLIKDMEFADTPLLPPVTGTLTFYIICRTIGRIAFPIYAFLITEGFVHTHDRKKYGLNLLIFALISELPWNLANSGKIFYAGQNVFFTLFLGFTAVFLYEKYKNNAPALLLAMLAVFFCAFLLRADYWCRGVGFILFLYIMRDKKILQAVIGSCFFTDTLPILAAFAPINMYNGKRGFIKGKAAKYLFYAVYPLHLAAFYLIKTFVIVH